MNEGTGKYLNYPTGSNGTSWLFRAIQQQQHLGQEVVQIGLDQQGVQDQ
jgi:hypothetical protein